MNQVRMQVTVVLFALCFIGNISLKAITMESFSDEIEAKPTIEISLKNADDNFLIKTVTDDSNCSTVQVELRSPRGIGAATLRRLEKNWPDALVIRWKIQGLESIRMTIERDRYEGFVENQNLQTHWSKRTDNGDAIALKPTDDAWCDISIIGSVEGHPPKIPLQKDEWFELKVPKQWLENQPETIRFEWVDFHR
jgi:hypothetical protein